MLLAHRIKSIRISKKLTQIDMSERLDIEQATYSGYERMGGNLTFSTIIRIAEALECSVAFLVDINSTIYDENEWRLSFIEE